MYVLGIASFIPIFNIKFDLNIFAYFNLKILKNETKLLRSTGIFFDNYNAAYFFSSSLRI